MEGSGLSLCQWVVKNAGEEMDRPTWCKVILPSMEDSLGSGKHPFPWYRGLG